MTIATSSARTGELVVHLQNSLLHPCGREALANALAAGLAEAAPELGVRDDPRERGVERLHVARRDEEAGFLVYHRFRRAAHRSRDDRLGVRHRLEHHERQTL